MMHVDVARSRGIVCPAGRVLYSGQSTTAPLPSTGGGDGGGGRAMAELAAWLAVLAEAEADVGGG
jgi:hypothetical protein